MNVERRGDLQEPSYQSARAPGSKIDQALHSASAASIDPRGSGYGERYAEERATRRAPPPKAVVLDFCNRHGLRGRSPGALSGALEWKTSQGRDPRVRLACLPAEIPSPV